MSRNRPRPPSLAALLAAAACAVLAGWALAGRAQTPEPKGSTVHGRAVYEGSGRPVRRARISLMRFDEMGAGRSVLTNGRGEFRAGGVAAGRYYVWVDAPGFISPVGLMSGGQGEAVVPAEEGAGKLLDVVEVDGEEDKEVTVRARRGGALGGRVSFADGEPAANVPVHVMRRGGGGLDKFVPSVTQAALATLRTDDRGRYRVAGLPPGEYVVGVAEPTQQEGARSPYGEETLDSGMFDSLNDDHLLLTFHPSAPSAAEATAVTVAAGEEHEDVDINIPERHLRTLSGVVRRRDQRPAARAKVQISRRDSASGALRTSNYYDSRGNFTMTDAHGRWRLTEIPDGAYTLVVTPAEEWAGGEMSENRNASVNMNSNLSAVQAERPRKSLAPARKEVEVSGDAADLVIELADGARVSGTVTVEGGKKTPVHVGVYLVRPARSLDEMAGSLQHYTSASGGEFALESLPPGKFFLHANAVNREGEDFYVKAITWQGRDLSRELLEVSEGAQLEGVRVVLATDPAVLRVRTQGPDKRPAFNVNVFLMPTDPTRWSFSTPPPFCSTGGEGECEIKAAPGEYLVINLSALRTPAGVEQEMRRRAAAAPRVSLRAGEATGLDLAVKE